MTHGDLGALGSLTDALYQRELAKLREVRDEEARLRAALARLDEQARAARDQPETALAGLRGIGGDMVWQAWVVRQRAALQSELARILVRKEHALPALRRAHGKSEAVRRMQRDAQAQARRRAADRQGAALLGLAGLTAEQARRDDGNDQTS